jgi:carboxymethylenebutenolidase
MWIMHRLFALWAFAVTSTACRSSQHQAVPAPPTSSAPAVATAAPSSNGPFPEPEEVRFPSEGRQLHGVLWRPAGSGPFPAVIYNHGSEREPIVGTHGGVGPFFRANGYVVLFPYRRGAGGSEGPYWMDQVDKLPESEQDKATVDLLDAENADVVAAIAYLRAQPYVDAKNVSVAGCSFGGIESILTAEKPLGLRAAVSFAGAAMAWSENGVLRDRLLRAVEGAKTPIMFVQAQNDFNTAPSEVLSEAMRAAGKPHELRIFPPFGQSHEEGHGKFCVHGPKVWGQAVIEFLRKP